MLRLNAADINGKTHSIESFELISVNQDENVPADDLSVTVPFIDSFPELCSVVLEDGGEAVFTGVVDEQQCVVTVKGAYIKIVARSMAAQLLDNESVPVNYFFPSASVIFSRHLEPCGISEYIGGNTVLKGALNVVKGTTNWQVLSAFCKNALGTSPRVDRLGRVNLYGLKNDASLFFCNVGGISYNSIKENNRRCKPLSDVLVKLKDNEGYTLDVENPTAKKRGIKRVRYLDASSATSAVVADKMIEKSNLNSYELTVTSPERLLGTVGAKVKIKDPLIGERDGLYVSSVFYSLSPDGEHTVLTLKKEY